MPTNDTRTPAAVGRSARLELSFERRDGKTKLVHAYAEPPFRVGRTFAEDDGCHMILATVAPGIFGGDHLRQTIRVGRGARVRLTSQSAVQIHPSPAAEQASIHSDYTIDDQGELRCFWDPAILFAASRFHQQIDIQLNGGGRLVWSDAMMAGREGRGERWAFAELSHELALSRGSVLEYLERYHVAPSINSPARTWIAGDNCYFGTSIVSGWPIEEHVAPSLHSQLAAVDRVGAGADRLGQTLLVVRILATAGIPFREARALISTVLDRPRLETGPFAGIR